MKNKRIALGKGLGALIPSTTPKTGFEIDIDLIEPNPYQPRLQFEPDKLEELAQSIAENGVLQPVILRKTGNGYQLVAGERRWRAAQKAGLARIPAIVQDLSDQKALELAVVENIQRDELSAIEEAHAYQLLIDQFSLSQEEVAKRVSRSRTAVTNTLRLLKLPKEIQRMVVAGELSMGHARALLPLSRKDQLQLAAQIVSRGLSVREVERKAKRLLAPATSPGKPPRDPNVAAAEDQLETIWKTRVQIRRRGQGGQVVFHFHSDEELDRLFEAFTHNR